MGGERCGRPLPSDRSHIFSLNKIASWSGPRVPVSQPVESNISQLSSHKSRDSEQRDLILLNTDEPDSYPPAIIEKESIPLDYTQGGTGNPRKLRPCR